ncbi:MAG: 4-hydroxy-tetrahydrodipicolinate reductase [Elusimicrobia bacterium]|nr:4-hydroxy-tetrahydrodipicolinate reductase [Elusimicrobiota bacterium]
MGRRVADLARSDSRFQLVAGVTRGNLKENLLYPLILADELPYHLAHADVLIDFSAPSPSLAFAQAAAKAEKAAVIGTTGFTDAQRTKLQKAAKSIPVFLSPNFSLGMNLLFRLAERASGALGDYDLSIHEAHHSLKKDAPSGTALKLAQAARRGRPNAEIPITSVRAGTIVGDHTLTIAGPQERLELTHRAESRDAFARGALHAALWIAGRKPGLYDMQDLLGLE